MPVFEIETFIEDARDDFRALLVDGQKELIRFLKEYLNKCSSSTEEEILKENLIEVYQEYLEDTSDLIGSGAL